MAPLSESAFRDRIRSLDRDAFTTFVADLWRARGFKIDMTGGRVLATRADPATTRELIAVDPDTAPAASVDMPAPSEIDVVVSRADTRSHESYPGAVCVLGVGDLYEMLLYAIPRAAADDIIRQHLAAERAISLRPAPHLGSGVSAILEKSRAAWVIITLLVMVGVVTLGVLGGGAGHSDGGAPMNTTLTPAPTLETTATASGRQVVTCFATPGEAMQYQVPALAEEDGVRTLWRFGTHEFRRYAGTYKNFNTSMHSHPFEHLLDQDVVVNETVQRSAKTAQATVTVRDNDGEQYSYTFTLAQVDENGDGCWRTDGLTYAQSG